MKTTENEKPIVLSLGLKEIYSVSDTLGNQLLKGQDSSLVRLCSMNNFVYQMNGYRQEGLMKNVRHLIISNAPPYFIDPNPDERALMQKYDIANRGRDSNFRLDYGKDVCQHIKDIIRLIQGEYPELPKPIVMCDATMPQKYYDDIKNSIITVNIHDGIPSSPEIRQQKMERIPMKEQYANAGINTQTIKPGKGNKAHAAPKHKF